jgi:hypothetical protein
MKIDFLRLLRYGIGGYLLIGGIIQLDYIVILMGAIMTLMAYFNVGCFGGQCAPNLPKNNNEKQSSIEDVSFEEVKSRAQFLVFVTSVTLLCILN